LICILERFVKYKLAASHPPVAGSQSPITTVPPSGGHLSVSGGSVLGLGDGWLDVHPSRPLDRLERRQRRPQPQRAHSDRRPRPS